MIRILIADDHRIVRDGLKQILVEDKGLLVAGEAASGNDVLKKIRNEEWDILLLDMSMPGKSGIELIKQIKLEKPRLPILVLSMHKENQYGVRAIKAGASGYLTKNSAAAQLISAVRRVAAGGVFISAVIAEKLATDFNPAVTSEPHSQLTDREYQIFQMIASGSSVSEIAEILSLSIKTISTHKANIMHKMDISSTAGLVHYALKHKLIEDKDIFPD